LCEWVRTIFSSRHYCICQRLPRELLYILLYYYYLFPDDVWTPPPPHSHHQRYYIIQYHLFFLQPYPLTPDIRSAIVNTSPLLLRTPWQTVMRRISIVLPYILYSINYNNMILQYYIILWRFPHITIIILCTISRYYYYGFWMCFVYRVIIYFYLRAMEFSIKPIWNRVCTVITFQLFVILYFRFSDFWFTPYDLCPWKKATISVSILLPE